MDAKLSSAQAIMQGISVCLMDLYSFYFIGAGRSFINYPKTMILLSVGCMFLAAQNNPKNAEAHSSMVLSTFPKDSWQATACKCLEGLMLAAFIGATAFSASSLTAFKICAAFCTKLVLPLAVSAVGSGISVWDIYGGKEEWMENASTKAFFAVSFNFFCSLMYGASSHSQGLLAATTLVALVLDLFFSREACEYTRWSSMPVAPISTVAGGIADAIENIGQLFSGKPNREAPPVDNPRTE